MMRKITALLAFWALCSMAEVTAYAQAPEISGELSGVEYCTQELCGQALFTGGFVGEVDGYFAFGIWNAAANHGPDPENGVIGPLPTGEGDETLLYGEWELKVYVLRGFWFRRVRFGGELSGVLTNIGGGGFFANNFAVEALLTDSSTSGMYPVGGTLFHEGFPPTVELQIAPAP